MNRYTRLKLTLPCGCVQVVRLLEGGGLRFGRRIAACGACGVHDGYRWPSFGVMVDQAIRDAVKP